MQALSEFREVVEEVARMRCRNGKWGMPELFDVKGKTFRSKFEDKYQYYVDKHGWQEKIEYAAEAA